MSSSSSSSSVAVRLSIRWLPGAASEPTDTLVLTGGKTGVFVDVRFVKGRDELDWAFAGYRRVLPDGTVKFEHWLDSRTLTPEDVVDIGHNTVLDGGETLEVGEMVNMDTGRVMAYEEIWEERRIGRMGLEGGAVFVVNGARSVWRARVGEWQLAIGRREGGGFWACRAEWGGAVGGGGGADSDGGWRVVRETGGCAEGEGEGVRFLPVADERWREGERVHWDGDVWDVIERDG